MGGGASLASSASWAVGSLLFRRLGEDVSPAALNLGKGLLSIIYLGVSLCVVGVDPMDARSFWFLGASGIIGITIGDTLFFAALIRLGPRLTVVLGLLGPVFTVLLARGLLSEPLGAATWGGIALTVVGSTLVSLAALEPEGGRPKEFACGAMLAILASLAMACSNFLCKVGVAQTSALQGTFVRMGFAVVVLAVGGVAGSRWREWLAPFKVAEIRNLTLVSSGVVVFGGFFLSLLSLKYIGISVAAALGSTEPLFILILTAGLHGHRVSLLEGLGALGAVAGVALIFAG